MDEKEKQKHPGYMMTYHCSNCGETFKEHFEFGERARQGQCPNCGVSPVRPYDF